ncbi:MAB_1171c family putative transporter [Streptomyces sp. NPDC058371]|uniref:MAB_1171c family putative transporter n=1 Tax=Streptomyces sp. NPDC058371 TaxID=3346463 RepID=UPI00365C9753
MSGLINYLSFGVLWVGLAAKLPDLARDRRDPFLRAICVVMASASLCFLLGAPPSVGAVNRVSGVPNLAAPLTYASITAYSAASLVLILYWRGGPDVRRVVRRWILGYAGVLVGIATLFALGHASEERRTDFDTYYATTPFTSAMIVLYLVAHLTAVTVTAIRCLNWARGVSGWLRAGLLTMGAGTVVGAGYSISKLAAVIARWGGRDWAALSSRVSPGLAGLGALITVGGILIPLAGPTLTAWQHSRHTYLRLGALERVLDEVLTRRNLRLRRPHRFSPALLLMWRQTSINNGLGFLNGLFDLRLYDETRAAVLAATGDHAQADATAWAAMIAAAVEGERDGQQPSGAGRLVGRLPEPAVLVRISEALSAGTAATARLPGSPVPEGVV